MLSGTCRLSQVIFDSILTVVQFLVVHGHKVLQLNIAYLKLAISDQNLELIPDYEQRIGVLKDLKFIDQNSTIQLKGRVACEVCFLYNLPRLFSPLCFPD